MVFLVRIVNFANEHSFFRVEQNTDNTDLADLHGVLFEYPFVKRCNKFLFQKLQKHVTQRNYSNHNSGNFTRFYNKLGYGFLEKVYENAMYIEWRKSGLQCTQQQLIEVFYEKEVVGHYYSDLLVENLVIIELKAAETLCEAHECQLLNYLKATEIEVGLLLNFGKEPKLLRKIFTNDRKARQ